MSMASIIRTIGVTDGGFPIPTETEWYSKLLNQGVSALIVVTLTFLFAGLVWSLRSHFVSWISSVVLKNRSASEAVDTMKTELPAIRVGVERLAEEASITLRAVHNDVQYIRGQMK